MVGDAIDMEISIIHEKHASDSVSCSEIWKTFGNLVFQKSLKHSYRVKNMNLFVEWYASYDAIVKEVFFLSMLKI